MSEQPATARKPPTRTRLVVQGVLSLVLVVGIFYYLLRGIDLATVWTEIQALTGLELATLVAIAGWNLCTYAWVWMSVTPGLGFWRAMAMTQATTAVANTVPGGSAIGIGMTYGMLGSWGYSRSRTTTAVLVSGVWNSFIKLGLPVLALALVALQGGATGGRVIAALLGIAGLVGAVVVFALLLRSEEQARRFGLLAGRIASRLLGLLRRPPVAGWELATVKFRSRTVGLVQRRWVAITVTSLVSHLSLYLVLLVTLRHVGVSDAEVSWAEVLAVFAFARLATAIPLTPGGAGFVEAVLIGGLVPPAVPGRRWPPPCWSTGRSPGCCRSRWASAPTCGGGGGRSWRRARRRQRRWGSRRHDRRRPPGTSAGPAAGRRSSDSTVGVNQWPRSQPVLTCSTGPLVDPKVQRSTILAGARQAGSGQAMTSAWKGSSSNSDVGASRVARRPAVPGFGAAARCRSGRAGERS